jgi:hypothetical protein
LGRAVELMAAFSLVLVDRELELEDFDLDVPPPAAVVVVDLLDLEVDDFFDREGYSISHFSSPSPSSIENKKEDTLPDWDEGRRKGRENYLSFLQTLLIIITLPPPPRSFISSVITIILILLFLIAPRIRIGDIARIDKSCSLRFLDASTGRSGGAGGVGFRHFT